MSGKYKVKFFYGDYKFRQLAANDSGAVFYCEHHFNVYTRNSNYTLCKIIDDTPFLRKFVKTYTDSVSKKLDVPLYLGKDGEGIIVSKVGQQDHFNLSSAKMPSVLLEPLFVSNVVHVEKYFNGGRSVLADCLVSSIVKAFPNGGLIAFSVGHKYKRSKPMDRGAAVWGRAEFMESDLAENVLREAKFKLELL